MQEALAVFGAALDTVLSAVDQELVVARADFALLCGHVQQATRGAAASGSGSESWSGPGSGLELGLAAPGSESESGAGSWAAELEELRASTLRLREEKAELQVRHEALRFKHAALEARFGALCEDKQADISGLEAALAAFLPGLVRDVTEAARDDAGAGVGAGAGIGTGGAGATAHAAVLPLLAHRTQVAGEAVRAVGERARSLEARSRDVAGQLRRGKLQCAAADCHLKRCLAIVGALRGETRTLREELRRTQASQEALRFETLTANAVAAAMVSSANAN